MPAPLPANQRSAAADGSAATAGGPPPSSTGWDAGSSEGCNEVLVEHVEVHHRHRVLILVGDVLVHAHQLVLVVLVDRNPLDARERVDVGEADAVGELPRRALEHDRAGGEVAQLERLGERMQVHGDVVDGGVVGELEDLGDQRLIDLAPRLHHPVAGELPSLRVGEDVRGGVLSLQAARTVRAPAWVTRRRSSRSPLPAAAGRRRPW